VLEVALEVADRTLVVVAGESGSGKSTLLRLLAGLERPNRGSIAVEGELLFDASSGVAVAPELREIGWMPQDYGLFPHLSVFENVAFGLRARRVPNSEAHQRVSETLERLGLAGFATRRPGSLSGGQQQRVALARALVPRPRLLLLDEPLSALDVPTRRGVRGELRRLLADLPCTTLLVTHNPTDALALGEHIAVLEAGRVTQYGSREELLARPRSPYIADFLGVNLLRGVVEDPSGAEGVGAGSVSGDVAWLRVGRARIAIPAGSGSGELFAIVDAREITLSRAAPEGSARNVFHGPIEELVPEPPDGARLRAVLATEPRLVAEITRAAAVTLGLTPGMEVWASFKATGVTTFR
jgi:molybdate transport system ATP-binding protein